ncbi:hypothetical protein BDW75DRAFT_242957 [Aspergillus navahoensis]
MCFWAVQSTEPPGQRIPVIESGAPSEDPHGPSALYLPKAHVPAKTQVSLSSPKRAINCSPAEDILPDRSYEPRALAVPHHQYLLAQQPYYLPTSTPATLDMPMSAAPMDVQQHIQLAQQQPNVFVPLEFHPPSHAGVPPVDSHAPTAILPQGFPYKQQIRLLSRPDGTDWGFLGVS